MEVMGLARRTEKKLRARMLDHMCVRTALAGEEIGGDWFREKWIS